MSCKGPVLCIPAVIVYLISMKQKKALQKNSLDPFESYLFNVFQGRIRCQLSLYSKILEHYNPILTEDSVCQSI